MFVALKAHGMSVLPPDWPTYHLGLDEVTDDLVVKVIDGSPFDSLLNVLFLQRHDKTLTSCLHEEAPRVRTLL